MLNRFVSYKDLNTPATEPPKALLEKNKVTVPAGLTKIEADQLIKETFAKRNKEKTEPEEDGENNDY